MEGLQAHSAPTPAAEPPVVQGGLGPLKLALTEQHFAQFEAWARRFVALALGSSLLAAWPALVAGSVGFLLCLPALLPSTLPWQLRIGYPLFGLACLTGATAAAFAIKRGSLGIHAERIRGLVLQSNALHAELAPLLLAFFRREAAAVSARPDYRRLLLRIVGFARDLLDFRVPDGLQRQLLLQLIGTVAACGLAGAPVACARLLGLDWLGTTLAALAALGCSLGPLSLLLVRKLTGDWALAIGTANGLLDWLRGLRGNPAGPPP